MKRQFISILFFCAAFNFQLSAQHIKNPSFEGKPGDSQLPPEWEHYGLYSTADTQPGSWEVNTLPADGNTYISLITRGAELSNGNTWESCYQTLRTPLKKGRTYQYSIDLARSNTFASLTETYTITNGVITNYESTSHDIKVPSAIAPREYSVVLGI